VWTKLPYAHEGIEPSTCSLRAKVVTAVIWANSLLIGLAPSVDVQQCPLKRYPIVTQFVTPADEAQAPPCKGPA
jgi:hypothetical protein